MGEFTLAGRVFRPVKETSVAQDAYTMRQLEGAGVVALRRADSESEEQFTHRFTARMLGCATGPNIVAGNFIDRDCPDETWTEEMAEALAEWIKALRDPADKATYGAMLAGTVQSFFVQGLGSWRNSGSSSEAPSPQTEEITPDAGGSGPS